MLENAETKILKALTLICLTVEDVHAVNFKPHPYTISHRHVAYCADHHNGRLNVDAIRDAERAGVHCGHKACRVPYDQHTYDMVCFVRPDRDFIAEAKANNELPDDISSDLKALKKAIESNHLRVDGFAFLEPQNAERTKP